MTAVEKIDYSLIPVIDVARELLGQETRERTTANEKHFPGHGACSSISRKTSGIATVPALAAMRSPSSASPPAAIIKPPSIGCGRIDTSHFSASDRRRNSAALYPPTTTSTRAARAIMSIGPCRNPLANGGRSTVSASMVWRLAYMSGPLSVIALGIASKTSHAPAPRPASSRPPNSCHIGCPN
jgi:hypothetical protein